MPADLTKRTIRLLALGLAGGSLFQVAGCVSGITPVVLSFFESAAISYLVGVVLR
jgi:hypothetical protein